MRTLKGHRDKVGTNGLVPGRPCCLLDSLFFINTYTEIHPLRAWLLQAVTVFNGIWHACKYCKFSAYFLAS